MLISDTVFQNVWENVKRSFTGKYALCKDIYVALVLTCSSYLFFIYYIRDSMFTSVLSAESQPSVLCPPEQLPRGRRVLGHQHHQNHQGFHRLRLQFHPHVTQVTVCLGFRWFASFHRFDFIGFHLLHVALLHQKYCKLQLPLHAHGVLELAYSTACTGLDCDEKLKVNTEREHIGPNMSKWSKWMINNDNECVGLNVGPMPLRPFGPGCIGRCSRCKRSERYPRGSAATQQWSVHQEGAIDRCSIHTCYTYVICMSVCLHHSVYI